jgi:acyl-CoA synthetase (AMP-forming)/AMP-acid ligase II
MSPVSNEPKTAAGQLDNMKELFPGSPLITSAKFGSRFSAQGFTVELIENVQKYEVECHDTLFDDVKASTKPQDLAAILFTSGSTGRSKAVQCTHAQLIASVRAKSAHLDSHGQTFMTWISFDHSANFCEIHLQSMYVASDQVHVPTPQLVVEPRRFFQVLSSYKVGYTFAHAHALSSKRETRKRCLGISVRFGRSCAAGRPTGLRAWPPVTNC